MLKNPLFSWVLVILLLLSLLFVSYKLYKNSSVTDLEVKIKQLTGEYESVVKIRNTEKESYLKEIDKLKKKYVVIDGEYKRVIKELNNVKKPETKKERVDRLTALGLSPLSN
jgi:hypothetical protein